MALMTEQTSICVTIRRATSTVEVRRGDELLSSEVIDVGGDEVDAAITEFVRTSTGLQIGPRTAERIKLDLGGASQMTIKGRSLETGAPADGDVVVDEVQEVALGAMEPLVNRIGKVFVHHSDPLARIRLAGGGGLLMGLNRHLERVTRTTRPATGTR